MILGIDSASVAGSVALCQNEHILCEFYMHHALTHSQTLLPMVEQALKITGISLSEIDCLAVTCGPGSFTGVRIGMATVKGLALPRNLPCAAVSTLEAMAYNLIGHKGYILPMMDARCQQVYTALFYSDGTMLACQWEDKACKVDELWQEIQSLPNAVFLGDGAYLLEEKRQKDVRFLLAPPALRYCRASSVCLLALKQQTFLSPQELSISYLRMPQAERERLKKQQQKGESL